MINLDNAVVYDIEVLKNVFTLDAEFLHSDQRSTWEISQYRDDRHALMQFFQWLNQTQTPMIGFNNEFYDYVICHMLFMNPQATYQELRQKSDALIKGNDRFGHAIWPNERFAPQIDLYKIHHFDNKAKTTSLKALQVNMRLENVVESELGFDHIYLPDEISGELIPYNQHDTTSTKKFAHLSMSEIEFRLGLIDRFGIGVMNYNSTKIGEKMLEQQLGDHVCYDKSSGRKIKRQTFRDSIALKDIIFPYIHFKNPEFNRVLEYLKTQVLRSDEFTGNIKTKGVFTQLHADVGGLKFGFGLGGIHASVSSQKFTATDKFPIRDIDVASLYPSIAIVNKLYPEHLGEAFIREYPQLLVERRKHKKGTIQNAAYKLAANGAYGKSNEKWSVFYDPKYTMTITVNGQLMLAMLAEQLLTVPTIRLIQVNTDGITYQIDRAYEPLAASVCQQWEKYTCLDLEDVDYKRMWIRDVNNYVAEDHKGKLKQKGAYWFPDPLNYADSISKSSPPAWHKDLSNIVSQRAAVASMVHGIAPEAFIYAHTDPFDFMIRIKVNRSDILTLGGREIQRTSRYFVANDGETLVKIAPPPKGAQIGAYKRASKIPENLWREVNAQIPAGSWDARIHTKNKSTYQNRNTNIQTGFTVIECNNAADFDFSRVNYDWYINEAKKLIIS